MFSYRKRKKHIKFPFSSQKLAYYSALLIQTPSKVLVLLFNFYSFSFLKMIVFCFSFLGIEIQAVGGFIFARCGAIFISAYEVALRINGFCLLWFERCSGSLMLSIFPCKFDINSSSHCLEFLYSVPIMHFEGEHF